MDTKRSCVEDLAIQMSEIALSSSNNIVSFRNSNTRSSNSHSSSSHSSSHYSRYQNEYIELDTLGKGAFGCVMKVQNKTDGQEYAVKRVKLRYPLSHKESNRVVQEAKLLASLHHANVVRYYVSWIETGVKQSSSGEMEWSVTDSDKVQDDRRSAMVEDHPNIGAARVSFLYIQMELCAKTLRKEIDSFDQIGEEQVARNLFEIAKGLKYIHKKGLCHRDLNPNNIFLDANGAIKIGDFGLAKVSLLESSTSKVVSLCLSKDVGTQAYKAPEIVSESYDNKVDLYSLGIILFELSYPMKSRHEREIVLKKLRSLDIEFPEDSEKYMSEWQRVLIRSMLNHCASERLSLDKLLLILTEKFPLQDINIPEVMDQALLDPTSTTYQQVMSSCFKQVIKHEEDINFDFPKRSYDSKTHFTVHSIVRCIEAVFQKYGASRLSTPLLTPSDIKNEPDSVVQLLTRDGLVVNLPYNARICFARYVVWREICRVTRYDTLQTYKEHGTRSHPRNKYECVFDIVTPKQGSLASDAQILTILVSVCEALPWKDNINYVIFISHTDLVRVVLLSVGVKERYLSDALQLIGRNGNWESLQNLESDQLECGGLDKIKLNRILRISGSPERFRDKIIHEVAIDCKKTVERVIYELQATLRFCTDFGLHKIAVNVKWCSNVNYYSGVLFTAMCIHGRHQPTIIADGGRYDDILLSFRDSLAEKKPDTNRKMQYATGISVYPIKVLQIQPNFWPPELVVVACQKNESLEKEVFGLAQALRSMGINCRMDFDVEASDIQDYAADENVMCIVEYLPEGKTNVTHKAIKKLELPFQDVYSYSPSLLSPTIQISSIQEEVISMVTLNFPMAV